ncbi:MAG: 50S ribosomal protein L33 [Patescibacteria group bacterium]|jgi:large subunit ribosomal protein L33
MSQERLTKLECKECKTTNYYTQKNKKKLHQAGKLELKKHCPQCGKHTPHKEIK